MRWWRHAPRLARVLVIVVLLFAVPYATLVVPWSGPGFGVGTAVFVLGLLGLPGLMFLGHGPAQSDPAARVGDALLGVVWVLFSWSVLGTLARLVLALAGVAVPAGAVAVAVLAVAVALIGWGVVEARRLPRVRTVPVAVPGLGPGLAGLRLVVITDTHFGPLDRSRWSARLVEAVNALGGDVVCHVGDLADGPVAKRRHQVAPLAGVRAPLGRFYVPGNHEYFGDPNGWLNQMADLGWTPLRNAHHVVCRAGDRLVVAGVDDPTAVTRAPGQGPDLPTALTGADPALPVVLLAHQPVLVEHAVRAGVALQISGHTHGGQIWPFHYLVRLDQPALAGLSRHGERTWLYTSPGSGFWGPPLRVFAPSEITVLTLTTPEPTSPVARGARRSD